MKFTINKKALQKAMSTIGGCIERKSTIPVLQNVLLESVGENTLRLTSTNLDISIRVDADATITEAGRLCLNGEKMMTLVPALPDGDISFAGEKNFWANVKAGNSKPRIGGVDPANFPEIPSDKSTPISFDGDKLRQMIGQALPAVSLEESRFTLAAIKMEIANGKARSVATDGMRLAIAGCDAGKDDLLDVLIPQKAAIEIMKIDGETVAIGADTNHIFAESDGLLLIARRTAGQFPNYQMIIPKASELSAVFDVDEMGKAVKRCGMFASLNTVRCDISADTAKLTAANSESGEIEETVSVIYSGEPISVGFNWPHLADFLNLAGEGKMELQFSEDKTKAAVLTAENLPDYQYILTFVKVD